MDTRDQLEEVGKNIDVNKGVFVPDNKTLLNDYITPRRTLGLYQLQCLCGRMSCKY